MKKTKKLTLIASMLFAFTATSLSPTLVFAKTNGSVPKIEAKIMNKDLSKLKEGQVYHGFKLVSEEYIKDYDATVRHFVHEKSGATLFNFSNTDKNKTFAVTFRTPTDNNTGKPHVLEHALLMGGSKKYPVKQLLNHLMKGSLSNDMNGYTGADRTFYPFSTVDANEFTSLMDVYLDMVYNARVESSKNIFDEQAWHYQYNKEAKNLNYTGTVFSEMKGAMSSPDQVLLSSIRKSLFPDTTYKYNSGGDPKHIPELSYEELVEYYNTYYHPSNSNIFLYGDMDILEKLEYINENFLSSFNKKKVNSEIKMQKPFAKRKEYTATYGIAKEQSPENQDCIALNFAIGKSTDTEKIIGLQLLNLLAINNPASPLRQNLNNAGFTNVSGMVDGTSLIHPYLSIIAKNTNESRKDEFVKIIEDSLKEITEKGIDSKLLKSTLNSFELSDRLSKQYTKKTGIGMYSFVIPYLLYNEDPIEALQFEDMMKTFNTASKTKYFEKLITDDLLNNNFSSLVILKANPGQTDMDMAEERAKLDKFQNSLSTEELNKIIKSNEDLLKWQLTPDSQELLKKIPVLDITSLNPQVDKTPLEVKRENGVKVLHHDVNTFGTNNVTLNFDTTAVKQEQIPYIQLLSNLLGNMNTKHCTYMQIPSLQLKYTQGISISANVIESAEHKNVYNPLLKISFTSLNENMRNALNLVNEIISNTRIDDKDRLKLLISQLKAGADGAVINNAHGVANSINLSKISNTYAYSDTLNGYGYYNFINDLNNNFDSNYDEIIKNLKEVSEAIFNKNNLTVSIAANGEKYDELKKNITSFTKKLPAQQLMQQHYKFNTVKANKALTFESQVGFNVQSFNYKDLGFNFKGSHAVLTPIINDFLWNTIRVRGNAYGAFYIDSKNGNISLMTYRDPRVKGSYEDFKLLSEFLKNIQLTEEQLNTYKLKALSPYFSVNTSFSKASISDYYYFAGINQQDLENDLDAILNTTVEDIKAFGQMFEEGLKTNNITTIGNSKAVEESKELFNEIDPLK